MLRNKWRLPAYKSGVITLEYMEKVRNGHFYAPRYGEFKTMSCVAPPRKEAIFEELSKVAAAQKPPINLGFTAKRLPDLSFLLDSLSGLTDAGHRFFDKVSSQNIIEVIEIILLNESYIVIIERFFNNF